MLPSIHVNELQADLESVLVGECVMFKFRHTIESHPFDAPLARL